MVQLRVQWGQVANLASLECVCVGGGGGGLASYGAQPAIVGMPTSVPENHPGPRVVGRTQVSVEFEMQGEVSAGATRPG